MAYKAPAADLLGEYFRAIAWVQSLALLILVGVQETIG